MTFYIFKERHSKKKYIIQCHSLNRVCVCVKAKKLTLQYI